MKVKTVIVTLALIFTLKLSFGADPENIPRDIYPDRVTNAQNAGRLPIGTRIAIECRACKTRIDTMADPRKAYLSWYDAGQTHRCPNCAGTIAFKGSDGVGSRYSHACTHCGASSAYVCAEHGQHSKQ